jgi:murein DD-endopeptidase MepM/ murein hydrolase activator NlpD
MIKIVKAAIVVLLSMASAGFGAEPGIPPAQDLFLLNTRGISTRQLLGTLHLKEQEVDAVLALLKLDQVDTGNLKSLVIFSPQTPGQASPLFLEFAGPREDHTTLIGKPTTGRYVTIDRRSAVSAMTLAKTDADAHGDISLRQRIGEVGLREGLDAAIIQQLQDLFADDFDRLQAEGSAGSFEFMSGDSLNDGCGAGQAGRPGASQPDAVKPAQPGPLLEAALTVGDKTRRLYGFDAGQGCEYFDGDGASARAFIARHPAWMRKVWIGFGLVRHPILDVYKFHPGVDWIVAEGGPVRSVGDGVVGNITSNTQTMAVTVQYRGSTEATFDNLSRLAKGIEIGRTVHRDEVIGFATGGKSDHEPVVHYELGIDGRIVDPLSIELPAQGKLTGATLAAFQRRRDQIDEQRAVKAKSFPLF